MNVFEMAKPQTRSLRHSPPMINARTLHELCCEVSLKHAFEVYRVTADSAHVLICVSTVLLQKVTGPDDVTKYKHKAFRL